MRIALFFIAGVAAAAPTVKWANLPLAFEPNAGQSSAEVRYLARGASYTLHLNAGETVLGGRNRSPLRTRFSGANVSAAISGEGREASTTNYFIGNDPAQWRTSVPNFARVRYAGVYSGIDLVYYGTEGTLEYDWVVAPGADPRQIRMDFDGADRLRIDTRGDLVITAGGSEYRDKRPVAYQEIAGKRVPVSGRWSLHGREASFRLGAYDRNRTLIIDPPLIFASYYGGNGADYAYAVAADSVGNTYIAGSIGSANFGILGTEDAFVTKISPNGSRIFTSFIGGNAADQANGIAVDVQGNMFVTGSTGSLDFPLKGAIQPKTGGSGDVFAVKLAAGGAPLLYSTYLGGIANDSGSAIAIDAAGNAYIAGTTFSADFPTVNPFQAAKGAQQDAFVAKINPTGTAWVYVTYLGGNNVDEANGIAVDAAGNAYVAGYTASTNFPLQSPLRTSNAASVDAFVTKLNPAGSALVYSTYLGGSATDYATAIAVDSSGSAYVTGIVTSDDFPVVNPIDPKLASHAVDDIFVTKLNPAGSALVYSTYLGGGSADDPYAIALDSGSNAYITGRTNSSDFPLVKAIQSTRFAFDMFVAEINPAGSALLFSTFLGGNGNESGRGIAVDHLGNIHIAGEVTSTDFPVKNAFQGATGGGGPQDALVLVMGDAAPSTGPAITKVSDNLVDGGPVTPGGWFYVKGTDLADVMRIWGSSDFSDPNALPTDLNGVEVLVNGARVPVYFISPTQVNAQAPSNISGTITVQVVRLGLASNTLTVPVAVIQPSIYNYQVGGKSYAAALYTDYSLMGDPAVVPGTRKAQPGDIVQLYAAGLASTASGPVTSVIPVSGVTVTIGTTDAPVSFAGLVAPGQFQVNFTVPQLPDGEYNITVSVSGKTSPTGILFEIGQ
ncbi:MAG TPA: SBBP repeat-containing protein [Bryobacteraceae bacterium]